MREAIRSCWLPVLRSVRKRVMKSDFFNEEKTDQTNCPRRDWWHAHVFFYYFTSLLIYLLIYSLSFFKKMKISICVLKFFVIIFYFNLNRMHFYLKMTEIYNVPG